MRFASGKGSPLNSPPLTTQKTVVLRPMPSPNVRIATTDSIGYFTSIRSPERTSVTICVMSGTDYPRSSVDCLLSQISGWKERASQARRSTPAFAADVVAVVVGDVDAGRFEPAACNGIPGEHQRAAAAKCQHVGAHGGELLVGHLHQGHAPFEEKLAEWDRHQWRVDDRKIAIDWTNDRHEMEHISGAPPVWQGDHDQLIDLVVQKFPKLRDSRVVRPVSPADDDRPTIEPEDVSTFELAWRHDGAGDRIAHGFKGRLLRRGLTFAGRLAHAAKDRGAIVDE